MIRGYLWWSSRSGIDERSIDSKTQPNPESWDGSYEAQDAKLVIVVIKIGHRSKVYR